MKKETRKKKNEEKISKKGEGKICKTVTYIHFIIIYDTVSDVVECKVRQCQQNSDA